MQITKIHSCKETKQKYIESYSWDVEKVKWTMAEMEAIAI